MRIIILAAGQGTRLRPLTDDRPKCMVEVNGTSIIERQLNTMHACGIKDENITIVCGYCSDILKDRFKDTKIHFIVNEQYDSTNMVFSLMCAREMMESEEDIIISYGDIIYDKSVFDKILKAQDDMSVIVDDGWYEYWSERCENPLDDAETLMFDQESYLTEIGQKTTAPDMRRLIPAAHSMPLRSCISFTPYLPALRPCEPEPVSAPSQKPPLMHILPCQNQPVIILRRQVSHMPHPEHALCQRAPVRAHENIVFIL